MLNGLYPVFVFQKLITRASMSNALSRAVPIYINEALTGIALISQSRRAEFATDAVVDQESGNVRVKQRGITNGVDIELKTSRENLGINLLLPLADIAFQRANTDEYLVSYFNRNVILFRAKITSFVARESNSDSGVLISIGLAQESKTEESKDKTAKLESTAGDKYSMYKK